MNYSLLFLKLGSNSVINKININFNENIIDFCCDAQNNFYFITSKNIGLIKNNSIIYPLRDKDLTDITSFYFNMEIKMGIIVCKFGSDIYRFSLDNYNQRSIIGSSSNLKIVLDRFYDKLNIKNNTQCVFLNNGQVYFLVPDMHRGFFVNSGDLIYWLGNGKGKYSVSNLLTQSSFYTPNGLINIDNNTFYVYDDGNNCIRKVTSSVKLVKNDLDCDKRGLPHCHKLRYKNNILFFMNDESVKYFSESNKAIGTLYKNNNIVSFDLDSNKNIIILNK